MQKLFIISNESIFENEGNFFCDNLDMKITPERLEKDFKVNIFARKSHKKRFHKINLKNIRIFENFLSFTCGIINSFKDREAKYLIISITPYTFLANFVLKMSGKKTQIYLRSDGYGEYKAIFGFFGPFFYHIMFSCASLMSDLIACRKSILRGKRGKIIYPSHLNEKWFLGTQAPNFEKIRLLYVGRIKKEKGIFSLINLIKNERDINLTIVGAEKDSPGFDYPNVTVCEIENNPENLIKLYDNHNMFILPSYTEGHPMVLLESLARMRPVIIFNEIEYVVGDKKGIFVSKREVPALRETIDHIKKNYQNIFNEMKKNNLPTNNEFIKDLKSYIINSD